MSLAYEYNVFQDTSRGWTTLDLQVKFWVPAESYALKRWSRKVEKDRYQAWGETLRDCANDSLLKVTGMYHDWCERKGLDPDDRALFWSMVKRNIDWAVADAITAEAQANIASWSDLEGDDDHAADDDLIRTQLSRHRPPSMLHRDIADKVAILPTREKLLLALRYFEEMDIDKVGRLAGTLPQNVTNQITRTTTRIMAEARNMIVDEPAELHDARKVAPFEVTVELTDWLTTEYGTNDVHAYLGYVTRHYYADVSYVLDFLRKANGEIISFGTRPDITPEQMSELDARYLAGEPIASIAEGMGLTTSLVGKIIRKGLR